jgi:hypothetical protein
MWGDTVDGMESESLAMSRKRSRAEVRPGGPMLAPGPAPIWGRYLPVHYIYPRGWITRPFWRARGARAWLILLIAAPLTIVALVFLLAAIQALLAH